MLMACGARTGLREERVVGSLPDWRVQTVCQCGNCKTVPWCATNTGAWLCDIGPSCSCSVSGQIPVTRQLNSTDPNGAAVGLYCLGPANNASDNEAALLAFGGPATTIYPNTTFCLLSNDGFLRASTRSIPLSFNRSAVCGAAPYRCSTVPGFLGSTHAFADELNCPKADATGDPSVFVPGTDATTAIANARPILGAMCALWSTPQTVGTTVPGVGAVPRFHCFARRGAEVADGGVAGPEVATPDAGVARISDGVVITDPGHALGGDDCVALQAYNYLRITRLSDGSTATATLTGTGSAATSVDGMALTDFRLQQVGTTTYSGNTLSGLQVHLEDLWSGVPAATTGTYTVPADGARAQGQYTIGSSTYSVRLTAINDATMRWNGIWYTIDARFSSDDIGVQYDLHIELDLARAPPRVGHPGGRRRVHQPGGRPRDGQRELHGFVGADAHCVVGQHGRRGAVRTGRHVGNISVASSDTLGGWPRTSAHGLRRNAHRTRLRCGKGD